MTTGGYGGGIFFHNVGAYLPYYRGITSQLQSILLQWQRICSRQPVKPALQPVSEMSGSLTLEAGTYEWVLRLPCEILEPMVTALLVNNWILTPFSEGFDENYCPWFVFRDEGLFQKPFVTLTERLYRSYMQLNRLFRKGTKYVYIYKSRTESHEQQCFVK